MINDLISIIVPVYNVEMYIERCIKSIQQQKYENFELILVDDGSKDKSLSLCKKFEKEDTRIKVISKKNGGASSARNAGLDIAKGKYIIFVDSDDYISKSYVENLYFASKVGDYDIVQCEIKETSQNLCIDNLDVAFNKKHVKDISKIDALNKRIYKVSVCGKIYKRRIFEDFRFKEGIIYEDDASYYIFIYKSKKIAVLKEILYYYYMSQNSVMRNDKKNKSIVFIDIYKDRMKFFEEKNEVKFLEGTYSRYCLVLLLAYISSIKNGTNQNDISTFRDEFIIYYNVVMKSKYVDVKEKMLYFLFKHSPKITSKLITMIKR